MTSKITHEDFAKLDLRIGKILDAEDIKGSEKMLKLNVSFGSEIGKRTICAGIKKHYTKEDLEGKKIVVLANLEPRKIMGILSEGMVLAAEDKEGKIKLLSAEGDIEEGSKIR